MPLSNLRPAELLARYRATLVDTSTLIRNGEPLRYRQRLQAQRALLGLSGLLRVSEGPIEASAEPNAPSTVDCAQGAEELAEPFRTAMVLIAQASRVDPYSVADDFIAHLGVHSPVLRKLASVLEMIADAV